MIAWGRIFLFVFGLVLLGFFMSWKFFKSWNTVNTEYLNRIPNQEYGIPNWSNLPSPPKVFSKMCFPEIWPSPCFLQLFNIYHKLSKNFSEIYEFLINFYFFNLNFFRRLFWFFIYILITVNWSSQHERDFLSNFFVLFFLKQTDFPYHKD